MKGGTGYCFGFAHVWYEEANEGFCVPLIFSSVILEFLAVFSKGSAQLCLTVCDSMVCSPPGSFVHGILQVRVLEWVAISSSGGIFPTQGSNLRLLCLLDWQVGSLPLVPAGKPGKTYRSVFKWTRLSSHCQLRGQICQIIKVSGLPGRFHIWWPLCVNTEECRHHPWFLLDPKEGTSCRVAEGFTKTQKAGWFIFLRVNRELTRQASLPGISFFTYGDKRVLSELAFELKVYLSPPSSLLPPQSRVCSWTKTSSQGGYIMVLQVGLPTESLSSQLWFILAGTHSSPGTQDPGTWVLYLCLLPSSFQPVCTLPSQGSACLLQ